MRDQRERLARRRLPVVDPRRLAEREETRVVGVAHRVRVAEPDRDPEPVREVAGQVAGIRRHLDAGAGGGIGRGLEREVGHAAQSTRRGAERGRTPALADRPQVDHARGRLRVRRLVRVRLVEDLGPVRVLRHVHDRDRVAAAGVTLGLGLRE